MYLIINSKYYLSMAKFNKNNKYHLLLVINRNKQVTINLKNSYFGLFSKNYLVILVINMTKKFMNK